MTILTIRLLQTPRIPGRLRLLRLPLVAVLAASLAMPGVAMAQDAIAAGLAKERLTEFVRMTKLMGES